MTHVGKKHVDEDYIEQMNFIKSLYEPSQSKMSGGVLKDKQGFNNKILLSFLKNPTGDHKEFRKRSINQLNKPNRNRVQTHRGTK